MEYQNPQTPDNDVEQGKTIAIVSYITLIGWIIAIIMHQSQKTKFGAYHLRQSLGLFIFAVGAAVSIMILGFILPFLFFLSPIINIGVLVLLIIGIINASNGKATPLPLIGSLCDKMLSGIS